VDGWRLLGASSGSAEDLRLGGRPSAPAAGSTAVITLLTSGASRSRNDRENSANGPEGDGAGWVACAGFRIVPGVRQLQVGGRIIAVPGHGYAVAAWRSPPALTRPAIVAIGADGARLSELRPHASLDSSAWESVERALSEDPPPGPERSDPGQAAP